MEDEDEAQSPSRSPSQSASRSPSAVHVCVVPPSSSPHHANGSYAGPVTVTVTVAAPAPPHHAVPVAVPIHPARSSPAAGGGGGGGGGGGAGGGREDCWSEGATSTLIDAWGERYLELSRGNLKQKHWQEVAEAVTSRDGYTKAGKSDVQCKNRIDTLKKKYKAEKNKISASGGAATSSWRFFQRLDVLLGPSHKPSPAGPVSGGKIPAGKIPAGKIPAGKIPAGKIPAGKIPAGIPIRPPARRHQLIPQRKRSNHPALRKRKSSPPLVSSKSPGSSADSSDGFPPPRVANGKRPHQRPHQRPPPAAEEGGRTAELHELTRAILRFAEVYERVESSKLRQAMEMEKQRMEFTRELELQRMEFLMKTQMELSQLKSHHHGSGSSRKRKKMDDAGGSGNHHHHNNNTNSSNNSDNNG